MLFNNRKSKNPDQFKHKSLLGILFVPHFGESVSSIGKAVSLFVKMITVILSMNGLLPKNHPILTDETKHVSLSRVLNIAWSNLSFTQEGLPKVLLFFAVFGAIILTILSIIIAFVLGVMGSAHAQTPCSGGGCFTTPNPTSDLASNWLTFLLDPTAGNSASAIQHISSTTGLTMPSTTIQSALMTALGLYSDAMLIIAAFILFYHLASMVVETAHHGVPMGKRASQIWAPIRLVVAVGLLVPVNGSLNCGQFIVLKVAQMGSALASNVWQTFVQQMATNAKMPPLVSDQDLTSTVFDLTLMYACEYAYNYGIYAPATALPALGTSQNYINGWVWSLGGTPAPPPGAGPTPGKYSFSNQVISGYDVCGSYTIPTKPTMSDSNLQATADKVYADTVGAFLLASANAATQGMKIQTFMTIDPAIAGGTPSTIPITPSDIKTLASGFETNLAVKASSALSSVSLDKALSAIATKSALEGWIAAGAFFNTLTADQAQLYGVVSQSIPSTVPPNISASGGPPASVFATSWYNSSTYKAEMKAADSSYTDTIKALSSFAGVAAAGAPSATPGAGAATPSSPTDGASCWNAVGCILKIVGSVASKEGIWQQSTANAGAVGVNLNNANIGVQFNGGNPLLEMAAFGQKNITAALSLFNYGIACIALSGTAGLALAAGSAYVGILGASITGGASLAAVVGAVALTLIAAAGKAIAGFLFFIGVLFFTIGGTIAYVVPLLPFMHFFFNTITWIACVAEAVIGIPMAALAHLNPEGDGLPGGAKNAYQMIFSVVLRPVMMVFGLICGLLIMYVAVGLLNALYALAVSGNVSAGPGNPMIVSNIMYTVIYVVILYSVANHAFALIGRFPNQAMEWFGGKGLSGERMGDPGHIGAGVTAANAYFGSRGAEQLQKIGGDIAQGGGQAITAGSDMRKLFAEKNKKFADESEQEGHTDGELGRSPNPGKITNKDYMRGHEIGTAKFERDERRARMGSAGSEGTGGGTAGPSAPSAPGGGDLPPPHSSTGPVSSGGGAGGSMLDTGDGS